MNPFITKKTYASQKWKTIIAWICAFMAFATVVSIISLIKKQEWDTAFASVFIFAVFITPVCFSLSAYSKRNDAQIIAELLSMVTVEELSFSEVEKIINMSNIIKRMRYLLAKGYIQNIDVDMSKNKVTLLAPNLLIKKVKIDCPYCGAHTEIVLGRSTRCEYCGQTIACDPDDETENI